MLQQSVERQIQANQTLKTPLKNQINNVLDDIKRDNEFNTFIKIVKKLQNNVADKENQQQTINQTTKSNGSNMT